MHISDIERENVYPSSRWLALVVHSDVSRWLRRHTILHHPADFESPSDLIMG